MAGSFRWYYLPSTLTWDFSYDVVPLYITSNSEAHICIICGSIPSLKPLFSRCLRKSSEGSPNQRAMSHNQYFICPGAPATHMTAIRKTAHTSLDNDVRTGNDEHLAFNSRVEGGPRPKSTCLIDSSCDGAPRDENHRKPSIEYVEPSNT